MMRHFTRTVVAVTTAAACAGLLATASTAPAGANPVAHPPRTVSPGTWGSAQEVPGTAALNVGGQARVNSVSCPSTGTCGAGGYYLDNFGQAKPFAATEKNGTWDTAAKVPGNLNGPEIDALSCASGSSCSAGGQYLGPVPNGEVFVAGETDGTWGKARRMPGILPLNGSGYAKFNSVSCPSPGDCSAGGSAIPGSGTPVAYVIDQTNGTWGKAEEVPGIAAINSGGNGAGLFSLSCPSAGNCSGGGLYEDHSAHEEAFVVSETNGSWGKAEELPGSAALNIGGYAIVGSVSCAAAGNCEAGGYYADGAGFAKPFVAGEADGTWGKAKTVPGIGALNSGDAQVSSVSCGAAGNCAAGGYYTSNSNQQQVFVVSETNGTWGTAEEIPGIAALNAGGNAVLSAVSCGASGNCAAGGYYRDSSGHQQAFVVSETNGTWGTAEEVPGIAALNQGENAQVSSVSCGAAGNCAAGGYYTNSSGFEQAFVVNETG